MKLSWPSHSPRGKPIRATTMTWPGAWLHHCGATRLLAGKPAPAATAHGSPTIARWRRVAHQSSTAATSALNRGDQRGVILDQARFVIRTGRGRVAA